MNNIQSGAAWKCACGFENKAGHGFCVSCGRPRPVSAAAFSDEWDCVCGFHNKRGKFCASCGMVRNANGSAPTPPPSATPSARVQAQSAPTAPQSAPRYNAASVPAQPPTAPAQKSTFGDAVQARPAAEPVVSKFDVPKSTEVKSEPLKDGEGGVPWETKPSKFQLNKRTIPVIVVAVILLIGAFWGYSVYRDKLYAAKCEELVAVMMETQEAAKSLGTLSPDANVSQEELANRFADLYERAKDLESSLSGKSGSAANKEQYERMMAMVGQDKEMLQKASEILKTAGKAENKSDLETLGKLHQEFEAARKEVQAALGEVKIPGQEAGQTISYQALGDNMRIYVAKKLGRSEQYLAEKMQQYQTRLQADNEALKKKSEVVFLTERVMKDGKDILIQGKFYNGTPNQVVGIGEMLVDVTLNQFDGEVTAITDFRYEDPGLARTEIAPGNAAGAIHLRLTGKAPNEDFNNFIVRVHKIHWTIRRLAK